MDCAASHSSPVMADGAVTDDQDSPISNPTTHTTLVETATSRVVIDRAIADRYHPVIANPTAVASRCSGARRESRGVIADRAVHDCQRTCVEDAAALEAPIV